MGEVEGVPINILLSPAFPLSAETAMALKEENCMVSNDLQSQVTFLHPEKDL